MTLTELAKSTERYPGYFKELVYFLEYQNEGLLTIRDYQQMLHEKAQAEKEANEFSDLQLDIFQG